jgi:hypothetical protein
MEQLKRCADYVRILSACLPFLPPNLKEVVGRQKPQGFHNHVRDSNERELQTLTHRADGNLNR